MNVTFCCIQEDAERLLKNCSRYDLLIKLYQNTCKWDKVVFFSSHVCVFNVGF